MRNIWNDPKTWQVLHFLAHATLHIYAILFHHTKPILKFIFLVWLWFLDIVSNKDLPIPRCFARSITVEILNDPSKWQWSTTWIDVFRFGGYDVVFKMDVRMSLGPWGYSLSFHVVPSSSDKNIVYWSLLSTSNSKEPKAFDFELEWSFKQLLWLF